MVVIPQADAPEVLQLVRELLAREEQRVADIKAGVTFFPEINFTLQKKGIT